MGHVKRWMVAVGTCASLVAIAPAAAHATDYTWTGATASSIWSDANNWQDGAAPSGTAGTLTFPVLTSPGCESQPPTDTCYATIDDVGPLSIDQLAIDDTDAYTLHQQNNSSLSIGAGGVQATASPGGTGSPIIYAPLDLTAPQTWSFTGNVGSGDSEGALSIPHGINPTDDSASVQPLTLTTDLDPSEGATGGPVLKLDNSELGTVTVSDGVTLSLTGTQLNDSSGAPIDLQDGGTLQVNGRRTATSSIDSTGGDLIVGDGASPDGTLIVGGDVALDSGSTTTLDIDQTGSKAGTDFSQLVASGSIQLDGNLVLRQGTVGNPPACSALATGSKFTLISDSNGAISGTFANVSDGSTVMMPGCSTTTPTPVQINYTPTAVVATVLPTSTTTTSLSVPASSTTNQPVTLTATIAGATQPPTGTVTFHNSGAVIPNCGGEPLTAGAGDTATATCTTSFAAASSPEALTAAFSGTGGSGSSSSSPAATVTVGKGATSTVLSISNARPSPGTPVTYTATVTSVFPGPAPVEGAVQFRDTGTAISGCAPVTVTAGTATCTTTYSAVGAHSITATYGGDANFTSSTEPAQVVHVVAAVLAPGGTTAPLLPTAPNPPTVKPRSKPPTCKASVGRVKVKGSSATVPVAASSGGASCTVTVQLTATEKVRGSKVLSVSATRRKVKTKVIVLGSTTVTIAAGQTRKVRVSLNAKGRRLLASHHRLRLALNVTRTVNRRAVTVFSKTYTFKAPKRKR